MCICTHTHPLFFFVLSLIATFSSLHCSHLISFFNHLVEISCSSIIIILNTFLHFCGGGDNIVSIVYGQESVVNVGRMTGCEIAFMTELLQMNRRTF